MKTIKRLTAMALAVSLLATPLLGLAADDTAAAKPKPKPYVLKICIISGDKLGEMGEAYTFEFEGREIKLCCKGCLKDFKKEPAKWIKKIEKEEAKLKAKEKK
jgi:hypothetical protein